MTTRIAPGVGANLLGQHSAERNQDATAYVGNLEAQVTEELLWELFVQAGPVVNVYVPKDRVTNLHQGYGFVEFRSEEDADYAIKVLNMIKLYGKPIRVNKASQDKKSLDVGANLFVGNLDPDVDEKLLYDTFSAFGVIVTNPKIMRDPETGNSRGFGFISYDSFDASDAAIEAMNGQYLCNRQITVSYAYKKDTKGERHGTPAERVLAASNKKREDFSRTKHDKSFSKWKILIGPSDWEDYKANKEGAERYRVANLPSVCGPGLYEIGVAVCATGSGRDVDKLGSGSESIVVVYLGQADNVKSRLQHYGRSGSHLVNGFGLFKDVFSRGFPIVYRWAPMSSKSEAERTEAKLLERFDYAWNKVGNDARRPNDVLNKIEKISSQHTNVPKIFKMLQSLREQKVGIPIKAEKLPSFDNKPNYDIYRENVSFFDRIFKFSRSQPRLVPHFDYEVIVEKMENAHVCGVLLSDGSVCNDLPVKARKRCAKHKGRRLTSVSKTSIAIPSIERSSIDVTDDFPSICGVILLDGSPCSKPPSTGRKRCEEHKGMRVNHIMSKSLNLKLVTERNLSNLDLVDYCGVNLGDGKFCDMQPVKGRKRCEQHKGKRVNAFASNLLPKNQWPNAGHNNVHALPIPDVSHT